MTTRASIFNDPILIRTAVLNAFGKLTLRAQAKNFVMFVVYIGAILCTGLLIFDWSAFNAQIALWLWFTVLFANFSEALAEGRGRAQANSLKQARREVIARRLVGSVETPTPARELKKDDLVVCQAGDIIPGDGDIVEGVATVDESAITGESAPVVRESGGDRCAVTGGTMVISDRIVVRITSDPGSSFLDRMISLIEGASRKPTPNEVALGALLLFLTIIFIFSVGTLKVFAGYSEGQAAWHGASTVTIPVMIALLVCLIPTTIGALLSAIGISGIDRLVKKNVLAMSGRAVEAAGDIDVLLLDKTGTITLGNRVATTLVPAPGVSPIGLAEAAQLASFADETPEGRSIVVLAKKQHGLRGRSLASSDIEFIPFSAHSRMSGVNMTDPTTREDKQIRKGAIDAVRRFVEERGGSFPRAMTDAAEAAARAGATPLAIADGANPLGIVVLKDTVKGGIREKFAALRKMGIRTVMITGDNPLTAASIAAEAGVDDFIAEATPEMKLARIRAEQSKGHMVGMIGDGTNDAPALAQADVGVAMNTGTQAAREAGNMIDLDSNPTKLIDIVETGKQLLMTRGSLTTFSLANDVAKYFAIIPAMFSQLYGSDSVPGPLNLLNITNLESPESAILSAVIFNAVVIVALIPIALKGVAYRPLGSTILLQRNLAIYGIGGVLAPFFGIKAIDVLLNTFRLI